MLWFKLQELVDKETFEEYGPKAWMFFNSKALVALDNLRDFFKASITVNNWHIGGRFQFRGYRPQDCKVGARLSQHRLGNAFDCDIKGYTAEEARQKILQNQNNPLLEKIMRLEGKVGWLHFDLKPPNNRIHVFSK